MIKETDELFDVCFSSKIDHSRRIYLLENSFGRIAFGWRADQNYSSIQLSNQSIGERGKMIFTPAFRPAVGCPRIERNERAAARINPKRPEQCSSSSAL